MDAQQNFQERMNRMKAYNFRQQKDQDLRKKIFHILKSNYYTKQSFLQQYYQNNLYCKVIKALIDSSISMNQIQGKIEQKHQENMMKQFFSKWKEQLNINKAQRLQKTKITIKLIKNNTLIKLRNNSQRQRQKKTKKQIQELQSQHNKYNTTQQIFKDNQLNFKNNHNPHTYNHFNKVIQESRRTNRSNYTAINNLQNKRKFNAIKQLPQIRKTLMNSRQRKQQNKLQVQSKFQIQTKLLQEQKLVQLQRQRQDYNNIKNVKRDRQIEDKIQRVQIKQQNTQLVTIQSPLITNQEKEEMGQNSKMGKNSHINKDKQQISNDILWILSAFKLYQYSQMQSIIQSFQQNLKSQSTINEKAHLNNTKKIIQKIQQISTIL